MLGDFEFPFTMSQLSKKTYNLIVYAPNEVMEFEVKEHDYGFNPNKGFVH